jgi:OOP family OmpA-OmpF porin
MRGGTVIRVGMLLFAAAIVLLEVSPPAGAQEAYLGASYLSSSGEFDTSVESFDPDDSGWKLFGGYNFNKYWGMELAFYDLGNLEDSGTSGTFSADVSVYDLGFRGILPVGERFEIAAKLGFSNVSVDSSLTGPIGTTRAEASDWEFAYGLGLAFKIGKRFGLRAEWEAWDVADSLQAYSLGAYWRFGQK